MEWQNQELVIVLSVAVIVLLGIVANLERRLRKLTRSGKTETVEDSLKQIENDLKTLTGFKNEMTQYLGGVENRLKRSVSGIATVRFNPFKGAGDGGNKSFAASFISENGNGVIVSSIYAREHRSVFAKPIKNFKAEYELTPEEKESLSKAREQSRIKS